MVTLVISPHLDDAVLSLGGSIATWARTERVVIATVYTDGPPLHEVSPAMRKWADYPARRSEDAVACAAIGAETRWLGLHERAFRKPFLTGLSYFTTPPDRSGFGALPAVAAAFDTLDVEPARICVPLGIGNHVDHVEALVAATDWAIARGWRDRLVFYEDFYALSRTMRRRHPVARTITWPLFRAPLLRARRLAGILRAIALAARGPDATTFLSFDATWTMRPSPIDEVAKLAAIASYPSQAIAFGGMAGIARALRAYHAIFGGEPLWFATQR